MPADRPTKLEQEAKVVDLQKIRKVLDEANDLLEDSGAGSYAYGAREALAWVLGDIPDNEFELSTWCKSLNEEY